MDKIWDRKSFQVRGHWPLWRGWKKRMTTQNRQKSNAKKKKKKRKKPPGQHTKETKQCPLCIHLCYQLDCYSKN